MYIYSTGDVRVIMSSVIFVGIVVTVLFLFSDLYILVQFSVLLLGHRFCGNLNECCIT